MDCKCLVCVRQCLEACKECEKYQKAPVTWCKDYSEQCKTNLTALQDTLEGHIYFTLSNDMRDIVKNTIKVLKTMIQERTTSEEC